MGKKQVIGECRACGALASLTEEHVPPKASPNDRHFIEVASFDEKVKVEPGEVPPGLKRQGGVRRYSLCGRCNNNFGGWYNIEFGRWYRGGGFVLSQMQERGIVSGTFQARDVFPLRILNSVASMFISINPPRFRQTSSGKALAKLLQNKETTGLPDGVRFYTYFNHTGQLRYVPLVQLLNIFSGSNLNVSEITFPPFGFVMTVNSDEPDSRLCEISKFADYGYTEQASMSLEMAVLPTHIAILPNDYRTLEEIRIKGQEQEDLEITSELGSDQDTSQTYATHHPAD